MGRSFGSIGSGRTRRSWVTRGGGSLVIAGLAVILAGSVNVLACSSTITTAVKDAATGFAWSGSEVTGASAYDTAIVTTQDSTATPDGTVSYIFFPNGNGACTGTSSEAGGGKLNANLTAPNSDTEGPLAAGSYAFQAEYSKDSTYARSTSSCETFTVKKAASVVTTSVKDASGATWSASDTLGAVAYDTATVGPEQDSKVITGNVTYSFFYNGICSGSPSSTDKVTMSGGTVPPSSNEGPLGVGSYSFEASYSGDSNYAAATGGCESLSVGKALPTVTTAVKDAASGAAWSGSETTGASAYDTATVGPEQDSQVITGTVTYSFFTNESCATTGDASPITDTVTLSGGTVPRSSTEGPLGAGSYSFLASYSGDANYGPAIGSCEPLSVGKYTPAVTTAVKDAASGASWSGSEATGASAYDTATVGPEQDDTVITGTVTYSFFTNGSCATTGDASPITDTVTLSGGTVPNSSTEGPLAAGSYSFLASYSGDANYGAAVGTCEPLSVGKYTPVVTTAVMDAANGAAWKGSEATGASAYDTATVGPEQDDTVITGTVTYSFFTNGSCASNGDAAPITDTVTMSGGTVPNSSTEGPLGAGSYSFLASYSGDSNYAPAIGGCEPLTVGKAATTVTSVVTDAASGGVWKNSELAGASAYDTAAVAPEQDDTPITGTVSYQFFSDGTCTGTSVSAGSAPVSDGVAAKSDTEGPLAAGSYSFLASYSGDANYAASIGSCEPLTVQSTPTPTPTSTPTSTPTVSPTGGVLGASTPGTGAGPSDGLTWLGLLLLTLGGAVRAVTGLIRRTKGAIENI